MPLGFERLNERTQRPNPLINFIKALPGPTSHIAEDFLSRIAAIVLPIMRANYIAVMALEEYPPNPEFAGRNFNAGEVIQLVLRGRSGGWLPFRSVQMVMVHELAHCKQMNHSRYFWGVRNAYAEELRGLWAKAYTGNGLWGKGRTILAEEYETQSAQDPREEPRSLCGGTFRSGGRKRKRKASVKEKPKESYAERQQRRIRRKFGEGGVTLGDDEGARMVLEKGKMQSGKPRVAGSKRGRELRAAAALARFDQVGKEQQVKRELRDSGSETESESEAEVSTGQQALDIDGKKMLDQQGRGLFKVCEDEDKHDNNVKRELDELHELDNWKSLPSADDQPQKLIKKEPGDLEIESKQSPSFDESDRTLKEVSEQDRNDQRDIGSQPTFFPSVKSQEAQKENQSRGALNKPDGHDKGRDKSHDCSTCAICSLKNDSESLTCMACGNVLDLDRLPDHWRCQSLACRGGLYVNAGDCGICGACGAAKRLTEE
ncbi:WLM-domain-containing protein [Viridothelium virens]|uniref:WLM-domain-containing protein n=1 Tax=Viridothelium virens TaxID=1048519 RepID=A0A6A6GU68_VIRVR|nr:WLM-domain-containing protein [Viridothelium virens]